MIKDYIGSPFDKNNRSLLRKNGPLQHATGILIALLDISQELVPEDFLLIVKYPSQGSSEPADPISHVPQAGIGRMEHIYPLKVKSFLQFGLPALRWRVSRSLLRVQRPKSEQGDALGCLNSIINIMLVRSMPLHLVGSLNDYKSRIFHNATPFLLPTARYPLSPRVIHSTTPNGVFDVGQFGNTLKDGT